MINCPACGATYKVNNDICPSCGFSPPSVEGFSAWAPDLAQVNVGFKAKYFAPLAQHEARSFWFRSRNVLIVWALRKFFPKLDSFLEVGCGTGYVLSGVSVAFPFARLVGSEIFTAGLGVAAARIPNASFVQMDARRVPYVNEFDVVAAFDVLEHIVEDDLVLENLHRAIRPGGGLLLTVPQHQWLWSSMDDHACHVRRYSAVDLHSKIRAAGFEVERSTSFVSLLLPAMFISRRHRKNNKEFDPLGEFQINPILNYVLASILAIERLLIRLGLNFPMGGSRLVVARKNEKLHDPV